MAPSGEHRPEDLGYKAVYDASIATGNSAIALRQRVAQLHTEGAGKTVAAECEALTTQAGITEKLAAAFATTAASLKIREDAARAWNRDAPKDSEIKAAEEAVSAAKTKLKDAAAASGDTSAASKELEAAQKHLGDLHRRRRDADKAYDAAEKRADAKLKELDGEYAPHSGGRGHSADGTPAPGTGTPRTGDAGKPAPSTGSGSRSSGAPGNGKTAAGAGSLGKTASGTPKPSSTPAATPSATKPAETSSGDDLSGLLTQLAAQQQQQPQAAQQQAQPTAAAAPAATTPQTQQPDKNKDTPQSKSNPLDSILGSDGVFGLDDATRVLGTPAVALGGGTSAPTTSAPSTPAAAVTPTAPAASAPSTTGLSAGTVTQPVTSGTSAANLHTSTDVTGRPAEQQRTAFSVGPETKTSGATTGTGTSTAPAHATGTRPMGGGMPMMGPMGAMGGPGGGGAGKDREQAQTTLASGSEESYYLHGRQAVDAAVPGGTIAQRDHPRRRPESDAA
ncbi:hypothetical protein [Mycobacteroides abscessus]|uniref:hypothetical protein n=1 Tax=Mycobacteroides abscessus TaxID=36809 RepID=UPI001475B5C7